MSHIRLYIYDYVFMTVYYIHICIYMCVCVYVCVCVYTRTYIGFPGSTSGKETTCQCRRHKSCRYDPWVGKSPWRRA